MSVPPWRAGKKGKAFVPVTPRHTLAPPVANPQPSEPQREATQWPESLRRFVGRCFNEVPAEHHPIMQEQLKHVITQAFENNTTWTKDWDKEMLPIMTVLSQPLPTQTSIFKPIDTNPKPNKPPTVSKTAHKMATAAEVLERHKRFKSNNDTGARRSESPAVSRGLEPIVGRSTILEKRYLRLTSEPDPETVRPLHILKQTLELLKKKWKEEQNYAYICDQFKSLRQDLTVQHIETDFTVMVYEIHARIALEKSDLGEYNQCQSRLKDLYEKGLKGNEREFLAYRILYLVHTGNQTEIAATVRGFSNDKERDPVIAHALRVNTAMRRMNYHALFRLYANAPNMGGYVMDSFVDRARLTALSTICYCYKPSISLEFVAKELAFSSVDECSDFLIKHGAQPFIVDGKEVLTKQFFPIVDAARAANNKVDIKGQI